MKAMGKHDELKEFNAKVYGHDYVELEEEEEEEVENPTWTEVICDVRYRKATWIASLLAILQQFSGVNAITFYSS